MSVPQPDNTAPDKPDCGPWPETEDLRGIDLCEEGVWDATVRPLRPEILRHLPLETLQRMPPEILRQLPQEILRQLLPTPLAPPRLPE